MNLPEHIKVASKVKPDEYLGNLSALIGSNGKPDTETTGLIGIKTKYNEDIQVGAHTAIWGSFFCTKTKRWGFKCCKVTDKNQVRCNVAEA